MSDNKDEKNISTIDVESEGGIAEAFELAAKQGVAEISLKIPVPHGIMETHGDAIDKLRARGTPIELIGSYIVSKDWENAQNAFRCCVLELVYERMAEIFEADVQFLSSYNLHRSEEDENQLELVIDKEPGQQIMALGFGGQADNVMFEEGRLVKLPVCKIESDVDDITVDDDINASIIATLDRIATTICNLVADRVKIAQQAIDSSTTKTHLYIITDTCAIKFDYGNKNAWAYITMCGFRG